MDPANPFGTPRLLFRAVESPDDDDLFYRLHTNPHDFVQSNARLLKPQSKADAKRFQTYVTEKALLGVVICLAPEETLKVEEIGQEPKPSHSPAIGVIHLSGISEHLSHHRHSEIGIDILPAYQGKGYGTEAIKWIVAWAFEVAALHRVVIQAFEYNEGARRLYERLGFKLEGRAREDIWCGGRFWDGFSFGMLEGEWKSMQEGKEK